LRRLFYQAGTADYFAAGAAAAGSEAAAGAEAAGAASTAGAGAAGAAALPQADKVRAIKMAAIRAENFIVFPSVDYKVTGVLDFFISIRYSLPRCERRQYSITIFENARARVQGRLQSKRGARRAGVR
jgi:hypothetical protein